MCVDLLVPGVDKTLMEFAELRERRIRLIGRHLRHTFGVIMETSRCLSQYYIILQLSFKLL